MGFLVRISLGDISQQDDKEQVEAIAKLYDRRRDWIEALKLLNRTETRQHLRSNGLSLDAFKGIDLAVVQGPPELFEVPRRYGQKLAKALYYLHTGRIVPDQGLVIVSSLTNSQFMSPNFPLDKFDMLSGRPVLTRSGRSLEDQFAYRYATATDGPGAAFLMQFRESVVIVALVYEDRDARAERLQAKYSPSLSVSS